MGKPFVVARVEHASKDPRPIASKSRDAAQVRRLSAHASVPVSQAESKMACFSFIEGWCNPVRPQSAWVIAPQWLAGAS
jgi:hypothetical protein